MHLYKHFCVKKNLLSLIVLLLPFTAVKAQAGATDQDLAAIRTQCQLINTAKLTKQHFTYESSGCVEDGAVDYYLNGTEIVKIVESGAIGDGSWVHEYYYSGGKLIFSYEVIEGGPAIGKVTKTAYRVYVKDGKAIRTMEDKKVISGEDKAPEAIQIGGKIFKAYKTKDFAKVLCG